MKPALILLTVALVFAPSLRAQAPAPAPTADQLKSWAAIRKERVDLLRDEIKQTDARIESRLDTIMARHLMPLPMALRGL